MQAKLKTAVKPPAHLKDSLLAQRKIVRPAAWWRQPAWLAAAACVALLLTLGALLLRPGGRIEFAQYRDAMADFVGSKLDRLDLKSHDVTVVRQWLTPFSFSS